MLLRAVNAFVWNSAASLVMITVHILDSYATCSAERSAPLKLEQVAGSWHPLCSITMLTLCACVCVLSCGGTVVCPRQETVSCVCTTQWGRMCWCSCDGGSDGASPNLRRLPELRGEVRDFFFFFLSRSHVGVKWSQNLRCWQFFDRQSHPNWNES